ncbi:MAG TPA: thiamine phosphate synthase [Pyrinomonadaceae bacterium]|nr:thiamine phosphate synthase [Pyrinomonadaceae bacterium]
MPLNPNRPLLYLITSGATNEQTTSSSSEYSEVLRLTTAAVAAGIDLVQIREKKLNTRVLFELATHAAEITRGTSTQLLINDRADVAAGAGADGVHLTTQSLPVAAVRESFGPELLIGVSTHDAGEAEAARAGGADFVVFGPVFEPLSKPYGAPVGVQALTRVASTVDPLPVIALGGVDLGNVVQCASAGAAGVAAITMFNNPDRLTDVVREVRARFHR